MIMMEESVWLCQERTQLVETNMFASYTAVAPHLHHQHRRHHRHHRQHHLHHHECAIACGVQYPFGSKRKQYIYLWQSMLIYLCSVHTSCLNTRDICCHMAMPSYQSSPLAHLLFPVKIKGSFARCRDAWPTPWEEIFSLPNMHTHNVDCTFSTMQTLHSDEPIFTSSIAQ